MTKYTGPIEELKPEEQVNTILYRLADALDYEVDNGIITANPDEVLDEAVTHIRNHLNFYSY